MPKLRISGALNIYCGFSEGMKEISVGVCQNEFIWLEICGKKREKKSGLFQKNQEKKWP